jgi:uncharacterized protein (DUF2267 family)
MHAAKLHVMRLWLPTLAAVLIGAALPPAAQGALEVTKWEAGTCTEKMWGWTTTNRTAK